MIHFVGHEEGDGVGVVVVEGVKAGRDLVGWIMEDDKEIRMTAKSDIPIGVHGTSAHGARFCEPEVPLAQIFL
jgi:hypothetical protein